MMEKKISSAQEALQATDEFYLNNSGFEYSEDRVTKWVSDNVKLPKKGKILDLCCGDGIWSKGFQNVNKKNELYGVDISQGAIQKARGLLHADDSHFQVCDTENNLPFPDNYFDLIFARGPGLYNQHNMDRPEVIEVIEMWHSKLKINGLFYSIFASAPLHMGTYTPIDEVVLPYNKFPRKTKTLDFLGGKYHHTIQSFLTPFWKAKNVKIIRYSFVENKHILMTGLSS